MLHERTERERSVLVLLMFVDYFILFCIFFINFVDMAMKKIIINLLLVEMNVVHRMQNAEKLKLKKKIQSKRNSKQKKIIHK